MLTRRRFIHIAAALAPSMAFAHTPEVHVEIGRALGAEVTLRIEHPENLIKGIYLKDLFGQS